MANSLVKNLTEIRSTLPSSVTLVAVSKTKPIDSIAILHQSGQKIFGENRVEELVQKHEALPKDIEWHMIGHLQSKKVKKIASFVKLIHSVDSLKLLEEINKQAKKNDRIIECLLQFHIAKEETKYGLTKAMFEEWIEKKYFDKFHHIKIKGVMGMATFTQNKTTIRNEFKILKKISDLVKNNMKEADIISMGMSGDYRLAIEEGSTMIRVGSGLFGSRK